MSGTVIDTSSLPPSGPGSRRRRLAFLVGSGVLLVAILVAARDVLAPFIVGTVLAYVFAPITDAIERIRVGSRPVPRWVAVLSFYVVLLTCIVTVLTAAVPPLVREIETFRRNAPRIAADLEQTWIPRLEHLGHGWGGSLLPNVGRDTSAPNATPESTTTAIRVVPHPDGSYDVVLPERGIVVARSGNDGYKVVPARPPSTEPLSLGRILRETLGNARDYATQNAVSVLLTARTFLRALTSGIFAFFVALMISAYLLVTRERIFAFGRSLVRAERQPEYDRVLARIDRGLAGVVRGQLVICLVNGVLSAIGFGIGGVAYWPVLAIIATVFSVVPIFGAILSSVPVVLVALHQGVGTALFVLAWIVGIHQLEANLLNPKIMGDAAKVHPVLVVFALITGEHFFGIIGALLAVPVLSIAQTVFLFVRERALGVRASSGSIAPPPGDEPGVHLSDT